MKYDSIQEPKPHHTCICLNCDYIYQRRKKVSKQCPRCGYKYKKILKSEFYKTPWKTHIGKNMEEKRKYLV